MARLALGVFVAVLVAVAAFPVRSYVTEPHEVVASTPSDYTGLTAPLALPARGVACADEVLFAIDARVARFGATAKGGPAADLEVVARGYDSGPYRNSYSAVARVPGGWTGTRQLDVPLRPPHTDSFGSFCVRNVSDHDIDLVGTEDGRAYSRPSVSINGQPTATELELRLLTGERSSYLSRTGSIMEHASTLKPFGAWWWWLLSLSVLVLAPLGVGAAIRTALPADAPVAAAPRTPAGLFVPAGVRRRVEAIPGWALLVGACVLAVVWFGYWGAHTHVFQNDEDQYVHLSRWLPDHLPGGLFEFDVYQRGLQRLEVWLLAVPAVLLDSPWSLFAGRMLNTIAFVSTAIPVYLLGRGLGLSARWAALPAALSAVVPWAVITTAFLTENLAYPACMWVVWATWRAAVAPSAWRDLLALALIVVGGLSRSALLVLAPVLPIAVLGTGLRCSAGTLAERCNEALRSHGVLWAAVTAAALALLAGAFGTWDLSARLAGGYGTPWGIDVSALLGKSARFFARVVVGTGFLPAVLALPWLAVELVRSREPARFAFALTVVTTALLLLYSLNSAGYDERYILYLGPLLLLPATLALVCREITPSGLAIATVALAVLLLAVPWHAHQGPFGYFVSPVESFYARAVGLRMDRYVPGDLGPTAATLLLAAGGIVLAVATARGRVAGRTVALLVTAVAAVIVVQTGYALGKHVNGVGSKSGQGLRARAFVDQTVPKGATVGEFLEGVGQTAALVPIWQEVQFYNERLDRVYAVGETVSSVPIGADLFQGVRLDQRTGRIDSPVPLPDYLVVPTQVGQFRVRGEVVRAQTYIPVALIKVAKPATAAWSASGFGPDGSLADASGAVVRVYGTGLGAGRHCVALDLAGAPGAPADWRLELRGRAAGAGRLAADKQARATLALPDLVQRGFEDVRVSGTDLRVTGISVDAGC